MLPFIFIIGFILFLVIILGIWIIVSYNKFITLNERVDNGKAQIATQLESRWDAVHHLIAATKQYATYESEVLENITEKRATLGKDSPVHELEESDEQLQHVVGRLIAISENYPDLKASDVYQSTMKNVEKFENHVRHARMIYNDVVTKFNREIKMFPGNIIAKLFRFQNREYFELTTSKESMPSWD